MILHWIWTLSLLKSVIIVSYEKGYSCAYRAELLSSKIKKILTSDFIFVVVIWADSVRLCCCCVEFPRALLWARFCFCSLFFLQKVNVAVWWSSLSFIDNIQLHCSLRPPRTETEFFNEIFWAPQTRCKRPAALLRLNTEELRIAPKDVVPGIHSLRNLAIIFDLCHAKLELINWVINN